MMLTDEHERRGSRQEPKPARNPRSPPSRAQREAPAAADMLPGSMRGQQQEEDEEGEQLPPMQQQQQRRASRGVNGSLTAHVLHGVKSGAWDMKAQMDSGYVEEQE